MHGGHGVPMVQAYAPTLLLPRPPLTRRSYTPNQLLPNPPGDTWIFTTITQTQPPHVKGFAGVRQYSKFKAHFKRSKINYIQRRVQRRGHKIGRRNGFERGVHAANWYFRNNGCWPVWDPLHRTPVCP
jgi:hypothetical protein